MAKKKQDRKPIVRWVLVHPVTGAIYNHMYDRKWQAEAHLGITTMHVGYKVVKLVEAQ